MTDNQAHILTFGKYKGQTVESIIPKDPDYLWWADENVSWFHLTLEERKLLYLNSIKDELRFVYPLSAYTYNVNGLYNNGWGYDYHFAELSDIDKFFRNKDIKTIEECSISFGYPRIDHVDEKGNVNTYESYEQRTRREDKILSSYYAGDCALQCADLPSYGPM